MPKRDMNLAQPVCGSAVSSMMAVPMERRAPGGRLSWLRLMSMTSWSPARCQRDFDPAIASMMRVLMMVICASGLAEPSGVAELPRCCQLSPTSPWVSSSSHVSKISRSPVSGRRVIMSTVA